MPYQCGSRYLAFQLGDTQLFATPDWCERVGCPRCGPGRIKRINTRLAEKLAHRVRPYKNGLGTNAVWPEGWIGSQLGSNDALRQRGRKLGAGYVAFTAGPGNRKLVSDQDLGGLLLVGFATVEKFVSDWAFGNRADWSANWRPVPTPGDAEFIGAGTREQIRAAFMRMGELQLGLVVGEELWMVDEMQQQLAPGMVARELRDGHV